MATGLKVHLDHLIKRQSIRYVPHDILNTTTNGIGSSSDDRSVRYDDIRREEWFKLLRKPDFQRETNAWTPEDCLEFLDSVVRTRIIPSIIMWQSEENTLIYVLDGAHRLSVLRAWMIDDWGDKSGDYYERRDIEPIQEAAHTTRELVNRNIGPFESYNAASSEFYEIADKGQAPKQILGPRRFEQATFYTRVINGLKTLTTQWENGDYASAEQSFLRINRRGQTLDPWEATLIEYRHSSYARSIMCIANGGESGHYWPEPSEDERIQADLVDKVETFSEKANDIYRRLFVPPFKQPVTDLNVPLMSAPAYFQKHKYLLEVIPLVVDLEIASSEDQQIEIMKRDKSEDAATIITNAERILSLLDDRLEHLISPSHSSKSLAIVPLFYWYNQKGQYARGLLYGFLYWLLSGSEDDVKKRKLLFAINRDRLEYLFFRLKPEIASLQGRGGAGLKATRRTAEFFHELVNLLNTRSDLESGSQELEKEVIAILKEYASIPQRGSRTKTSRNFNKGDKSLINIRELYENSIRCHICGGIVNLHYGGLQYDHTDDYALSKLTDPETGKPTHPFCNRHKPDIEAHRKGKATTQLPQFAVEKPPNKGAKDKLSDPNQPQQLTFWGSDDFPT